MCVLLDDVLSASVSPATAIAQSPTSIFAPAATPAHSIFDLSMLVLSVTLGIFLVVAGLLLYALIRFRQRPGDSQREPAQIYGSNQIELSWTVIPILIVVMLFLTTTRVILGTQAIPKPASRAGCDRDRASVLVGVSLSEVGNRDRQRAACSGQRSGASDADLSDDVVGGYGSQLLGSAAGGQDGRDSQPREHDVDRSADRPASTLASARNTAERSMPRC